MSLRIEETFQLRAPVDRVWTYLVDPRQVVDCLPGAELTEVQTPTTFLGRVKVKVGPVTAAYNGKVTITERDDGAYVVSMVGEGRETAGSGSVRMTMTSRLAMLPTGDTEVRVTADVDIVGKAAQFGRGMIESVNKQLFRQFTTCVKGTLERPDDAGSVDHARASAISRAPASPAISTGGGTPGGTGGAARSAGAQPVRVLPLVLRAVGDLIGRSARSLRDAVLRRGRKRAV